MAASNCDVGGKLDLVVMSVSSPLAFQIACRNSATLWPAGLLGLLAWVLTGALDGATLVEIMGVPLIVAAWLSALLLIDRWVMQGTTLRRRAR